MISRCRRCGQSRDVQNFKGHVAITAGKRAPPPAGGQMVLQLPPFSVPEPLVFNLRHHRTAALGPDKIKLHTGLPVTRGFRVLRPAEILKHRGCVIMDQFLPLRPPVG